ncbi:MAG: WG repeat-containing protein [Candidatus Kapaibacterium sp.]|nr:MAG: WG repeat-containing protein [Candidatus Kapabacteria bacterium]
MPNSPYNQLPEHIQRKFHIVYSELVHKNLTIFKNTSEKWGVLEEVRTLGIYSSYKLLIEPNYHSMGFSKDAKIFEAVLYDDGTWNKDRNITHFFDTKGNPVGQSEQGTSVRIDRHQNYIAEKDGKFGTLDNTLQTLIPPAFEWLVAINDTFFKVRKNGKYGIVDSTNAIVLAVEWREILIETVNNCVILQAENGQYFVFNMQNKTRSELPFDKVLRASSNSYKAPSAGSFGLFKSITNCTLNDEYDGDYSNYEILRYKGAWGIISADGKVVIPNEYAFIDFLQNPHYFKVCKGEITIGDMQDERGFFRPTVENLKWGVIDKNNTVVVPIEYDWIHEVESTLWVVYKGGTVFYDEDYQEEYWKIRGGKLGVYNVNKLITPIEYDAIQTSWFKVKDYIFVQKGNSYFDVTSSNYDVFTLGGEKIEQYKPHPKNHLNGPY